MPITFAGAVGKADNGMIPYMNQRKDPLVDGSRLLSDKPIVISPTLSDPGTIGFPEGGNIVFRWLEEDFNPTTVEINIYANTRWGWENINSGTSDFHAILVRASFGNPATTNYTFANRQALIDSKFGTGLPGGNPPTNGQTAFISSEGTYWYWQTRWVRLIPRVNAGTVTAYSSTARILTVTVPYSDFDVCYNQYSLQPSGYYSLCWMENGLHAKQYDSSFYILPAGYRVYDEIPDRTELNSRVAGEKGLYEDEFLTAGQVEAGTNVTLRWRNLDGSLTGYSTDAAKGGNLVIEATGGGGGVTRHQGANANGSVYYDEVTNIIRFQNFPRLHEEPIDGIIPIEFKVYSAPDSVGVIRAHGVNNNLYVSRGEGPAQYTIHTYPMFDAGFTEDQTVNHLRFRDTDTVEWNLLGTTMPTQTENGIIYRKGVVIRANAVAAFTGWYLQELNSIPQTAAQLISNNETIQVEGLNGVVCSLSLPNGTTTKLQIDRPLRIYTNLNPSPVGGSNTKELVFKHYRGTSWRYSGYIGNQYDNGYDPGKAVQDDCIELDTIPFYVKDIEPFGKVGRREVYALSRRTKSTMAQTQWAMDYDALGGEGRTLGYYQGITIPDLSLGGLGLYQAPVGVQDPVVLPGCRVDYHIVDGDRLQRFKRPYNQIDSYFNPEYYRTTIFQNAYYGNLVPRFPGLYRVTYRVQGLMTLPTGVTLNPVIHPRIHSFIMNNGTDANFSQDIVDPFPKHFNSGVNVVGGMWSISDFIPQVGTPAQSSAAYLPVINSRPWEVYGEGLLVFDGHTQGCQILLRYNAGTGENRFSFQVCYMYMSIEQVADSADMKFGGWSMPYKDTKIHAELNALSSNYNYVNF